MKNSVVCACKEVPEHGIGFLGVALSGFPLCSLPLQRVHEIKRMYLAPCTHGLFIT